LFEINDSFHYEINVLKFMYPCNLVIKITSLPIAATLLLSSDDAFTGLTTCHSHDITAIANHNHSMIQSILVLVHMALLQNHMNPT